MKAARLMQGARRVEPVWGTVIGIDVRDPVADGLLDELFVWFARVDELFSTWRDDSEISRLGRAQIARCDTSPEVSEVLDRCDALTEETHGAFDITFAADLRVEPRPGFGPIDPSGFVKGWALERAATMLTDAGIANFSINAGGDVLTRGAPEPNREWQIGIQHPAQRTAVAAVVTGTDLAVATSGRYERGDHIINPRTGMPANDFVSVTVVGDDLGRADAYATAAMVLGEEGMTWLAMLPNVEGMAITNHHTVLRTEGFSSTALLAIP
ncbi:MAG: FAD:protein transferase [Acidimicrobiaceae bacterium]